MNPSASFCTFYPLSDVFCKASHLRVSCECRRRAALSVLVDHLSNRHIWPSYSFVLTMNFGPLGSLHGRDLLCGVFESLDRDKMLLFIGPRISISPLNYVPSGNKHARSSF